MLGYSQEILLHIRLSLSWFMKIIMGCLDENSNLYYKKPVYEEAVWNTFESGQTYFIKKDW